MTQEQLQEIRLILMRLPSAEQEEGEGRPETAEILERLRTLAGLLGESPEELRDEEEWPLRMVAENLDP